MSESPLDHRRPPEPSSRRILIRFFVYGGLVIAALIAIIGPTGAEIRIDTGDLRYNYFGIPGHIDQTREPARTNILSLGAKSNVLKPVWVSVPYDKPHNPHLILAHEYMRAERWAKVDPRIATAMLEDTAETMAGPHPFSIKFHFVEPSSNGGWNANSPADEQKFVDFLNSKGIPIPATNPATKPASPGR